MSPTALRGATIDESDHSVVNLDALAKAEGVEPVKLEVK